MVGRLSLIYSVLRGAFLGHDDLGWLGLLKLCDRKLWTGVSVGPASFIPVSWLLLKLGAVSALASLLVTTKAILQACYGLSPKGSRSHLAILRGVGSDQTCLT